MTTDNKTCHRIKKFCWRSNPKSPGLLFWVFYTLEEQSSQQYKDRVEFIEDRQKKNSILRLHNITENDERVYYFRLITTTEKEKWTGQPGIQLKFYGNPLHSFISINNFIFWFWLDRCVSPSAKLDCNILIFFHKDMDK